MINSVNWPDTDGKYYLYKNYHTWFLQADTFEELFQWILTQYRTVEMWDYDGFGICQGKQPEDIGKVKWIKWKELLTPQQLKTLERSQKVI